MLKTVFRLLARLAILASVVYVARIALKRWVDGPEPVPAGPGSGWTAAVEGPRVAPPANPVPTVAGDPPPPVAAQPARPPEPEPPAAQQATGRAGAGRNWVAPDETGAAPTSHPVKAKTSSKVYREPGSPNYDQTRPDRCYPSAEAAEADGFTRAKR